MKKIGKIALTLCVSVMALGSAYAQDLAQATELYNMGATTLASEDKAGALKYFQQALDMASQLGEEGLEIANDSKNIIPKIYLQIAKEAAAAKSYDVAIENMALCEKTSQEYGVTEVKEDLQTLESQVYLLQGNELMNADSYAEAIESYKKVVEVDPENGTAYLRLGMAYSKLDDEANAVAAFGAAAEKGQKENADKQLFNMYLLKANKLYKEKNLAEALPAAKKAYEYDPSNANACKLLGIIALSSKKYDDAIAGFESYLSASPNAKDKNAMCYQLATAWEAKGDKAKACGYYKQIVNDPKFAEYAKYKINTELKCN